MRTLVVAIVLWFTAHAHADETARVRAHLNRAAAALRDGDAGWSAPQLANRHAALATLDAYIARGEFPRRTGDPYGALRPRFIDDRGVHCAVGALIAASGRDDLAHQIAASYEYAYVRDIDVPALAQWATEHGFTADELAMIQPSYSALPSAAGTKRAITEHVDEITIACATASPPDPTVTLVIVGARDGAATATATGESTFAKCFAHHASAIEHGGGAYMGTPPTYETTLKITVPAVQPLFDKAIAVLDPPSCTPRPNAIPRTATYDATPDGNGFTLTVTTKPSNVDVEQCMTDHALKALSRFQGIEKLHGHHEVTLWSFFDAKSLRETIGENLGNFATNCYVAGLPNRWRVVAKAHVDDPKLSISTTTGNPEFDTCLGNEIDKMVQAQYVTRQRPDGSWEKYLRVDREVDLSFDGKPVENPDVRDARDRKRMEELERHRKRY